MTRPYALLGLLWLVLQHAALVPLFADPGDWPDPVAHHVSPYHTSGLTHGPLLGRPTATSMRIWVRTAEPTSFRVVASDRLPLSANTPSTDGATRAEADNTGWVEISSLEPNRRYFYGVVTETGLVDLRMDVDDPWPSFRTLPDDTSNADALNNPDGLFNFRFSVGCCQRQKAQGDPRENFIDADPPAYARLLQRHADDLAFHVVNGDYTYEEVLDGTRGGYANNYKLYYERGRNVSKFMRYVPSLIQYNDHEVNDNIDGSGQVGLGDGRYLVRDDGLAVWQDYAGWANDPSPQKGTLRFGQARLQVDDDVLFDPDADFSNLKPSQVSTIHVGHYMKGDGQTKQDRGGANIGVYGLVDVIDEHRLRVTPPFKASGEAPYSVGTHHYFDRRVGNCHFFVLDTRGERSKFLGEDRVDDPDSFILGETQRRWLLEGVTTTDADFLFIISPDPWTVVHSGYHVRPERGFASKGDGFCGYLHEREQILPVFDRLEKPVMIFTGDVHNAFSIQITDNVWEFMCGPLNSAGHPIGTAGLPPFGGWFDSAGRTVKVKWALGFPDNVRYNRLRQTCYAVVQVNNVMNAPRPQGVGYQHVSYDEPQVVVQWYDGRTGNLLYAEGISTADAKSDRTPAPKRSRWPIEGATTAP